jgi:uncharacterized protein (DUF58 family)
VRPRKRAAGLVLGSAVLFVIGTNIQAGWLFVLAALLLGALAAGTLLPLVALRGLEVTIEAPAEVHQGTAVPVTAAVRNGSRSLRAGVTVHNGHLGDATVAIGTLRPGARLEATWMAVPENRGDVRTTTVTLRSAAPFGVAERRRRIPVDVRTLVLPRVVPVGRLFVETVAAVEPLAQTAPAHGQGAEYLAVRPYRPGDPMRHVHWGLTARHGQLMVREHEAERTTRLAIWIDTEREGELLDRCCTVAASILDAATTTGAGVRLAAPAVGGELSLATHSSTPELFRWLARVPASGVQPVNGLAPLGDGILRGVGTLVLACRPSAITEAFLDAAARLVPLVGTVVAIPVGSVEDVAGLGVTASVRGIDLVPWEEGTELLGALGARETAR